MIIRTSLCSCWYLKEFDWFLLTLLTKGYFEIFYVTFFLEKATCFNWLNILIQEAVLKADNNSVTSGLFWKYITPAVVYAHLFKSYLTYKFDRPEVTRDRAKINLPGHRVWTLRELFQALLIAGIIKHVWRSISYKMHKFIWLLLRACQLLLRACFTNTGFSVRIFNKLNDCVIFFLCTTVHWIEVSYFYVTW